MEKAQKLFLSFVDQWSSGCNATIQFRCESGRLMVDMQADLGCWNAQGCTLNKASPSRARRRERRAAERNFNAAAAKEETAKAAAEKAAAKATPEEVIAKAAAEEAAAKSFAEEAAAKAAAEEVFAKAVTVEVSDKAAAVEVSSKSAKAAAEEAAVRAATVQVSDKAVTVEVSAKPAAAEVTSKAVAKEVAARAAAERTATTAAAEKVGAKAPAAEEKSPSREICDSDQATTSDKISQPNLAAAEQNFYEFRARWITRLEKCTDDWALKTELLETLEDAYLAPVCDLSEKDFSEVKDMFFQGVLSPEGFLKKLQQLLIRN